MADNNPSRGAKRKWQGSQRGSRVQQGSRGNKSKDMGRNAYHRQKRDKRAENEEEDVKRRKLDDDEKARKPHMPNPFPEEEVAAEERRPKHKAAVMIGYSGSGYKGLQINYEEKTIEGDIFKAFVAAGAISKANAADPKKSSLVRCARTDKGVHAAGNVLSLKLIVEDPGIVQKINENLPPQIRVWGIQRTTNSFSSYQAVDSRFYEYLMPTQCFLPPHPRSWMGKRLVDLADEVGDRAGYEQRQAEVSQFWSDAEATYVKPILDELPEHVRQRFEEALYEADVDPDDRPVEDEDDGIFDTVESPKGATPKDAAEERVANVIEPAPAKDAETPGNKDIEPKSPEDKAADVNENNTSNPESQEPKQADSSKDSDSTSDKKPTYIKRLRQAYIRARRESRIQPERLARIQPVLDKFIGSKRFHNYTIRMGFHNPAARRLIRAFYVDPEPIIINGTEWLRFHIHGQSFMMHQIRKMMGMVSLIIRFGCPIDRIDETFQNVEAPVPKVPGLSLMLERPVFENYNKGPAEKFGRETIDFEKYKDEIEAFKRTEIYERMFKEEEKMNAFHLLYAQIDNLKSYTFMYLSSKGFEALERKPKRGIKDKDLNSDRSNAHKAEETTSRLVGSDDEEQQSEEEKSRTLSGTLQEA
ncbi:MAG: tRNA pseudouridine synthase 1 [Alyxoria varia]|nr:MAG: tRNA pseudouridine synthase 1 [Alyxoria varia]